MRALAAAIGLVMLAGAASAQAIDGQRPGDDFRNLSVRTVLLVRTASECRTVLTEAQYRQTLATAEQVYRAQGISQQDTARVINSTLDALKSEKPPANLTAAGCLRTIDRLKSEIAPLLAQYLAAKR